MGGHCKVPNDMGVPFVAVELVYHRGYFTQTIDPQGNQIATNINHYFGHLPVTILKDQESDEFHIGLQLPRRYLRLRIWEAKRCVFVAAS
ncbi:MAG: starch phosphorylase [Oceanicoccus sp.]